MSIKSRLSLRLIVWLAFVGIVLFALAGTTLNWTMNQLSRIDATRQFDSAGLYQLVRTIQAEGDKLNFNEELLQMIRNSGGWLQRIDDKGQVTDSFFTPADVPVSYGPGELTGYWLGNTPFPYVLYLWIQEKDGVLHTLIYGLENQDNRILQQLKDQGEIKGNKLIVPEELQAKLKVSTAWVQLLDANGIELASFNKPPQAVSDFSVQELALRSTYPDRYGTRLVSDYDQASGWTWVLSSPLPGTEPGKKPLISPEIRVLAIGIGTLLLAVLFVFVIASYWFGHRFGSPIVHVLKWLRWLGEGRYEEPANSNGISHSRDRKGKRKRKYRVYQDVIDSMDSLTLSLHRNERLREETERMRDEWIAGVSHDLKTPLSSIKGYAHVLDNETYEWTAEEVRSFARIILDKSSYMDELINDLTLTYQLRNGYDAPSAEWVEMNEYTAQAIKEASNHPVYAENSVQFFPAERPFYIRMHKPWFQRIVDNLVANALQHNENSTSLTVTIQLMEPSVMVLTFADNGKGLDEVTATRLFERYYRGTDTETRTEGSGLGMAVTKALVEGLGGSIEVVTSEGQGTSIILKWKSEEASKQTNAKQVSTTHD
jgi:two-component system OmpR family sensor kinase